MKLNILILTTFIIFSNCTNQIKQENKSTIDRKKDEEAIQTLLTTNWEASSAQNAKGVAETYLSDADAWIAGMPDRITGLDEIEQAEKGFGSIQGFQRYEGRIDSIRFISADAAIVETTGTTILDTASFEEKVTIVVARSDNNWRIAAWRVMVFDEKLLDMWIE
jgi:uncharacterized protein (TIGR02246 family)